MTVSLVTTLLRHEFVALTQLVYDLKQQREMFSLLTRKLSLQQSGSNWIFCSSQSQPQPIEEKA